MRKKAEFCKYGHSRIGTTRRNRGCKTCNRLRVLRYRGVIELGKIEVVIECQICGRGDEKLVVDHDHQTGRARGQICRRCNAVLGFVGDSTQLLDDMIDYLFHARYDK